MTKEEEYRFYQEELERLEYMKKEAEYKINQYRKSLEDIEHDLKAYQRLVRSNK